MGKSAWAERRGQRWIARYRDEGGKTRSAGTFDTKEQAQAAATRRASLGDAGDYLDMALSEYAEHWVNSRLGEERISRQGKASHYRTINRFVLQAHGHRKIRDFEANPWIAHQIVASVLDHPQAKPHSQRRVRLALGSLFRPLVKMQILRLNPMAGVEAQKPPRKKSRLFTPDEFRQIVSAFDNEAQRTCALFMVYSAMRPGEVFALRASDITFRANGSAIIEQKRKIRFGTHPDDPADLFEEDGSKTGDGHTVRLSAKQAQVLRKHLSDHDLSGDDLIFPRSLVAPPKARKGKDLSNWTRGADYGLYESPEGLTARHGTGTAYAYGCRCENCRNEMIYVRRESRAKKRKPKEPRTHDFMSSREWNPIWMRAVEASGVKWRGKAYSTRSAAATWMFKAGADLVDVQEVMNHRNAATTLLYLRAARAEEDDSPNHLLDEVF